MSTELKVTVWKELKLKDRYKMWCGHCFACGKDVQFWFFGATLGYMLEHIRRCEPFRYARSLANGPVRPVSSEVRLPALSGQEMRGDRGSGSPEPLLLIEEPHWPEAPVFGFRQKGW